MSRVQPDEEAEDLAGRDDTNGIWLWVITIVAAFGIVGLVTLYALSVMIDLPAPTRTMTEP